MCIIQDGGQMGPPVSIIQDEGTHGTTSEYNTEMRGHVGPQVSIIQDKGTCGTTGEYNTG